jgi:hypothetical protein
LVFHPKSRLQIEDVRKESAEETLDLRGEVTRGESKFHSEELHNFYSSSDIMVMKSRMGWAEHVV